MRGEAADFFSVYPQHRKIDERLVNWARWLEPHTHSTGKVQPMFRGFKSSEAWGYAEVSIPIAPLDAADMEKRVYDLPERNRDSIRWAYVYRIKPWRFCRAMGVSQAQLATLIHDGRQMLVNRLTR